MYIANWDIPSACSANIPNFAFLEEKVYRMEETNRSNWVSRLYSFCPKDIFLHSCHNFI